MCIKLLTHEAMTSVFTTLYGFPPFGRKRDLRAPTIESIWLETGLPHGFCGGDFPGTPSGNHPLEVFRQGHWLAAGVFTLLLGDSNSLTLALQYVLPLKFRDCGEHGEHKLAGRRSRVDCLLAADKFYLFLGQASRACASQSG